MADFVASNAAYTKTDYVHYLGYRPNSVYCLIGVSVTSLLLLFVHWALGLVLLAAGVGLFIWFIRFAERMHAGGTTNPAVVTCAEPFTIAVLAELTLVPGKSFPGVQFAQVPDPFHGRATVGTRLPVVCNYHTGEGGFNAEHWGAIRPTPIAVLSPHPEAVEHATRMIAPAEWQVLELAVKTIPDLRSPRMYLIPASPAADAKCEAFRKIFDRFVPQWR